MGEQSDEGRAAGLIVGLEPTYDLHLWGGEGGRVEEGGEGGAKRRASQLPASGAAQVRRRATRNARVSVRVGLRDAGASFHNKSQAPLSCAPHSWLECALSLPVPLPNPPNIPFSGGL